MDAILRWPERSDLEHSTIRSSSPTWGHSSYQRNHHTNAVAAIARMKTMIRMVTERGEISGKCMFPRDSLGDLDLSLVYCPFDEVTATFSSGAADPSLLMDISRARCDLTSIASIRFGSR